MIYGVLKYFEKYSAEKEGFELFLILLMFMGVSL